MHRNVVCVLYRLNVERYQHRICVMAKMLTNVAFIQPTHTAMLPSAFSRSKSQMKRTG
jgi:hypothetical protein